MVLFLSISILSHHCSGMWETQVTAVISQWLHSRKPAPISLLPNYDPHPYDGCVCACTQVCIHSEAVTQTERGRLGQLAGMCVKSDRQMQFLVLGFRNHQPHRDRMKECGLVDNTRLLELSPENTHLILSLQSSGTFDGFLRQNQTQAPGIWNSTVSLVPAMVPCQTSCVTADGGWLTWTETCGCYSSALWPCECLHFGDSSSYCL